MGETKTRPGSEALQDVDELVGWITVKKAAEIVGIQPESLSAKIYQKKFVAVRIGGIILCEKASVEKFAADRKTRIAEVESKREARSGKESNLKEYRELKAAFDKMAPEERAKLLAQMNGH